MNLVLKIAILQKYPCQSDFARAAGLHETVLSQFIRGRRIPTREQRKKIAGILAVPESELFTNTNRTS